ncbi:MAG TPA: winged helix DNA-binding domain-containing protein [Thermoanaerobaculia bacterium]|nr:winged helix DNA-binding domain-containing protein [Thermoanaerobaculia bacterium]
MSVVLTRADARRMLVAHLGLSKSLGRGRKGTRAVLERLRCIQLDPLDMIGTNADLVVMARTEGVGRGDVWRHLFPHHAFEHFAKERCILPARAFAYYSRERHEAQTPWWGHGERERRVPPKLVAAVLEEIRERGPLTARDVTDHGSVEPLEWSGWKGTAKATSMALEILWTRCDVVVAGRTESGVKIYDVPERALGDVGDATEPFARWALRERVLAAGLLTRASGAMWSMLSSVRTSPLVDEMIASGELVEVAIEDSSRRYLASPAFLATPRVRYDNRVRILGPLDPLLWDRTLVRDVFDFEYAWEVYKPAPQRKWGWYVCPLLYRDRLVGRIDARVEGNVLDVKKLWIEEDVPREAIDSALARHAELCGATRVKIKRIAANARRATAASVSPPTAARR